jgi:hypothetical protein
MPTLHYCSQQALSIDPKLVEQYQSTQITCYRSSKFCSCTKRMKCKIADWSGFGWWSLSNNCWTFGWFWIKAQLIVDKASKSELSESRKYCFLLCFETLSLPCLSSENGTGEPISKTPMVNFPSQLGSPGPGANFPWHSNSPPVHYSGGNAHTYGKPLCYQHPSTPFNCPPSKSQL